MPEVSFTLDKLGCTAPRHDPTDSFSMSSVGTWRSRASLTDCVEVSGKTHRNTSKSQESKFRNEPWRLWWCKYKVANLWRFCDDLDNANVRVPKGTTSSNRPAVNHSQISEKPKIHHETFSNTFFYHQCEKQFIPPLNVLVLQNGAGGGVQHIDRTLMSCSRLDVKWTITIT